MGKATRMLEMLKSLWAPSFVVFVGGAIAVMGTLWSSRRQASKNDEIAQLSKLNAELSERNSRLISEETLAAITGGDSWFYFGTSQQYQAEGKDARIIIFSGRHPMFDVTVTIDTQILDLSQHRYVRVGQPIIQTLGTVHGYTHRLINGEMDFSTNEGVYYSIHIEARNGEILQDLYFRKVNGRWTKADKVTRYRPQPADSAKGGFEMAELHKKIDDDYPGGELPKTF